MTSFEEILLRSVASVAAIIGVIVVAWLAGRAPRRQMEGDYERCSIRRLIRYGTTFVVLGLAGAR